MRVDRRFLNWGIFFVVLGAVPLAVQQGWVDEDVAARAWQLWPLLIVAAGIGLLLRRTSFEPVGGLIAAATAGAMLGGLIAGGTNFASLGSACGGDGEPFAAQQGSFGTSARVRLDLDCGEVNVSTAAGSGWSLSGTSDKGVVPDVSAAGDALSVESRDRTGFFIFGGQARDDWTVVLPTDPILDLDVEINAGSGTFNLTGAHFDRADFGLNAGSVRIDLTDATVSRLDVGVNAGSVRLILPNSSLTGSLEANAGSIAFCAPAGAGLRLTTNDNITGSNNFGSRGLAQSGSTWDTPGYAAAGVQIDLRTNANAASLTLNPEDGCR